MGELRTFYGLATVVFVGRSLVDLGHRQRGSDMIEPAALAKPTVVGRWTQNFADAVRAFRAADAMAEVTDGAELVRAVRGVAGRPGSRRRPRAGGRRPSSGPSRGATARHVHRIVELLRR